MLEEYMRSLSSAKPLDREEEKRLWTAYKEGGSVEARQSLIENYQPLVCREAMKYAVQETVMMDLLQEGMVGLMEAAERFDPAQGVAFSLYAVHRVRGRIVDFLKGSQTELPYEAADAEGQELFSGLASPDLAFEGADRSLLHSEVGRAMDRLPAKEKDVLRHVFLQEQTAAETADQLAVSTAYVYQLEKRGIRRLRGMLSRLIHDRK